MAASTPNSYSQIIPMKTFVLLIATLLAGCAQGTQHYIKDPTTSTIASFDVTLEKPFVSSISSLSGGQAAMILLVGPFTNNGVLLVARQATAGGEQIAFRERLQWGANSFEALLAKNTTYQLVAVVQGTRSGSKEIGTIQTGSDPRQHVTIKLMESEVSVR